MRAETRRPDPAALVPHRRFLPSRSTAPDPSGRRAAEGEPEARPGLYPGEPETCRRDWKQFLVHYAFLALLTANAFVYNLEGRAYSSVLIAALAVLPLHYALPVAAKPICLAAATVSVIAAIFGPIAAAWALGAATVFLAIARSPLPWKLRASIIGGLALLCAVGRSAGLEYIPEATWPLLGSLLMFRMIIYLYELKHARGRESLSDALSYFLLLPNACFLHFPVVDYRTLQRTRYLVDIHQCQATGLRMMLRGMVHLLIYRVIYHEILISPTEVDGPLSLGRFLVCNYLLYLRVSGQFHIAVGLLHQFGMGLPETHHNYLLATGFTDYWRRINIYWKDFMVRVVFNPVVFRLRKWGQGRALAAATVTVFIVTWALHAWQSFWLRGTWGFSAPDALFWGILGALVLVNVQMDARRASRRKGKGNAGDPIWLRSIKVAGTFVTIAVLWSLWSSPTLGTWLELMGRGLGLSGASS